jgi:hypothetical protein
MLAALLALVPARLAAWYSGLPLHSRILLVLASTVFVVELLLRRLAKGSVLYKRWTAFFQAIGSVWTAVILSFVYFLSVGGVSLVQKLLGREPLDRRLSREDPTAWQQYQPNPLGERAAARHQF